MHRGYPSMTGSTKGFLSLAKKQNHNTVTTHCFIRREVLVTRTVGEDLKTVLDKVVQMVNFNKSRPLKSCIFVHICHEIETNHYNLLLHAEVRWLSRG